MPRGRQGHGHELPRALWVVRLALGDTLRAETRAAGDPCCDEVVVQLGDRGDLVEVVVVADVALVDPRLVEADDILQVVRVVVGERQEVAQGGALHLDFQVHAGVARLSGGGYLLHQWRWRQRTIPRGAGGACRRRRSNDRHRAIKNKDRCVQSGGTKTRDVSRWAHKRYGQRTQCNARERFASKSMTPIAYQHCTMSD